MKEHKSDYPRPAVTTIVSICPRAFVGFVCHLASREDSVPFRMRACVRASAGVRACVLP